MQEILWMLKYFARHLSLRKQLSLWRKDIASWQRFWRSYNHYKQLAPDDKQPLLDYLYPCLGDDTAETIIEPIYFYQDAWAFEQIVKNPPTSHIDVGSHHKFVALLSKVVPVTMVDIRPLSLPVETLNFKQGSILELPFEDNSVESLSSLCVVEHIGLGRYGDPLDPYGSEKAISELKRVISLGGNLYISIPIGTHGCTFFNAHRVFEEQYIEDLLLPLKIIDRKYISGTNLLEQKPDNDFSIGLYHAVKLS